MANFKKQRKKHQKKKNAYPEERRKEASMKTRIQLQFSFVNPNSNKEFEKGLQKILVSKLLLLKIHNQPISNEKGSTREGGA